MKRHPVVKQTLPGHFSFLVVFPMNFSRSRTNVCEQISITSQLFLIKKHKQPTDGAELRSFNSSAVTISGLLLIHSYSVMCVVYCKAVAIPGNDLVKHSRHYDVFCQQLSIIIFINSFKYYKNKFVGNYCKLLSRTKDLNVTLIINMNRVCEQKQKMS